MKPALSLPELEAFIQVADARNFRVAAEQSCISQPALTRRIQSAEHKLGVRLLDRNTRQVELTAPGAALLPIARRLVFEFTDSLSELSEYISGQKGQVTIACLPSLAATLLPPVLASFQALQPRIGVALKPIDASGILSMVVEGRCDFGISVAPPPGQPLSFRPLPIEDELVLICARGDALARRRTATWAAVLERPYITSGRDSSITPAAEAALRRHGVAVSPQYEVANISVLASVVARGVGVAIVPRLSLKLMDTSGLAILPFSGTRATREVGIMRLQRRSLSLAADRFLSLLTKPPGPAGTPMPGSASYPASPPAMPA